MGRRRERRRLLYTKGLSWTEVVVEVLVEVLVEMEEVVV